MSSKFFKIIIVCCSIGLFSCQEKVKEKDSDIDILPPEEKNDELGEGDRPMPRSFLLAKMREEGELSSFTAELQRSGLEEEFKGKEGVFTIFAPSNAAYDRIPAKEIDPDGSPKVKESNGDLLHYYMVEGELTPSYLRQEIRAADDGKYEFRTALGEKLWATEEGDQIVLIDVLGNKARIVKSELDEYYGAYHIIDNVLQPGENRNNSGEN